MGFQSRKKSQSQHLSAEVGGLEQISSNHISERHGGKGIIFLCVFIVATIDHYDEVSSKSKGVTWELFLKLVDLTWNDPIVESSLFIIKRLEVITIRLFYMELYSTVNTSWAPV